MRHFSVILTLFCLLFPAVAGADELEALESTNLRLRAEYDLAVKQKLYFVFDLPARQVQFKASGIAVAELPIQNVSIWGQLAGDKVRSVLTKRSLFTPEREVLKIPPPAQSTKPETETEPKAEPKKFELQALELADMPTSFQLLFDDGLVVSVKPVPEEFLRRQAWTLGRWFWHLSRPLISDWNFIRKKTYTEILLTMPPKDAQLLYWSLADGSSCLLFK